MDYIFYRQQTDPRGKTRREYIPVGSGAAIPAAHGLPTGIGLLHDLDFCSVI